MSELAAAVVGYVAARRDLGAGSGSALDDLVSCDWAQDLPWAPGRAHLSAVGRDGWQWRRAVPLDGTEGSGWWRYDAGRGVVVPAGHRPDLDRLAAAALGRMATLA